MMNKPTPNIIQVLPFDSPFIWFNFQHFINTNDGGNTNSSKIATTMHSNIGMPGRFQDYYNPKQYFNILRNFT